jgi:hypothetical protein
VSEQGYGPPPSEEELRAAYEAQLKQLRVDDVLVQTVVSLVNLGGRKAGLVPDAEDEADPEQLRQAIEGVRALLPLVEPGLGPDAASIRDALSRLPLEYARRAGQPEAAASEPAAAEQPPGPEQQPPGTDQPGGEAGGPAQRSGRLWVPGR